MRTTAPQSPKRSRDERGTVAILLALFLTVLLLATAMVLDFGLVRVDRQVNKSAADAAASAGLQGLSGKKINKAYPYHGICNAIGYLQKNSARFDGVTAAAGTWTNGAGASTGNGCNAPLFDQVCTPGSPASWGRFTWTGTFSGSPITVVIQSGYQLQQSGWPEEGLAAVSADNDDRAQGCGQLAVIVTQRRRPGLGSLASRADIATSIRSVGRVLLDPGDDAPAMLLLRQTGCPVLATGSNGGGSYIHVYGGVSSDGLTTAPGSIHSDSDGSGCPGNTNIFVGKTSDGIVAYAAPLVGSPAQGDPTKPGLITSVAGSLGVSSSVIRDSLSNVYGSTGVNEGSGGVATEAQGRELVTRRPIDDRYLGLGATPTGVKAAVTTASAVFSALPNKTAAQAAGYKIINGCAATQAEINAIGLTDRVYVDCTTNAGYVGTIPIPGATVVFAGSIKPPGTAGSAVSLPNANAVYVFGDPTRDAISLANNSALKVNTGGTNVSGGLCTTGQNPSKALLVVKAGAFKQAGGLLQLCRTTVIMMGGRTDACLPSAAGTAPTTTPCGGGTGDAQMSLTGQSAINWTAPNTLDRTRDLNGVPTAAAIAAWEDSTGPEDLALWNEGANSYSIGGGGAMNTVGVFMAPNAAPFTISGGACQTLADSQYIASHVALNGAGTCLKMTVDPNAAVTIPRLRIVGLVR